VSEFDPFARASSVPDDEEAAAPDLSQLSDEELAALGKSLGVQITPGEGPRQPLPAGAGLVSARSLLPEGYDEDEGDFEPGGLYKGFRIIPQHLWPDEPRHAARWPTRFYVSTDKDTPGLVPWVGSQIVWPWERAWHVDLHREQVQSFLKEEKKEKKK